MATMNRSIRRAALLGLMGCVLLTLGGCLSRTLTVRTTPAGAEVWMDKVPIGRTPVTVPVTYGGTREFLILYDDAPDNKRYRPVRVRHDNSQTLLDAFPFDFFVEVLPFETRDDRVVEVELELATIAETAEADEAAWSQGLMERADVLRRRARRLQQTGTPEAAPFLREKSTSTPSEIKSEGRIKNEGQ